MQALHIYAGPKARAHIAAHGLRAQDVGVIPGAAGGPKGLILGPLDRFIFGHWLDQSEQTVHLVGASIGAWRMATACLGDSVAAFKRLERDYIHQHYEVPAEQKRPSAAQVSREFGQSLQAFYGGRIDEVLHHPRYRLHVVTSHGRHILHREQRVATALGYAGAYLSNAVSRRWLGAWLERVVFSTGATPPRLGMKGDLPFATDDFRFLNDAATTENFMPALQASCSIPFVLQAVHDIPGAPKGAYWDGGITDYHLHLRYQTPSRSPIVLYPHFQRQVVPGWLDKAWKTRHHATSFLDQTVVLAPNPEWVQTLPNGKLPDRTDFTRYGMNLSERVKVWSGTTRAAQQLADEFAQWLHQPTLERVRAL